MAYYARSNETEELGDIRYQPEPMVLVRQIRTERGYRIYETRPATQAEVDQWEADYKAGKLRRQPLRG